MKNILSLNTKVCNWIRSVEKIMPKCPMKTKKVREKIKSILGVYFIGLRGNGSSERRGNS